MEETDKIYNNLLEKCKGKTKSTRKTVMQPDGKKRYTITTDDKGDTVYTSEVKLARLDGKTLDYDPAWPEDIDYLLDEDSLCEWFYDGFETWVSFTDDGRVKVDDFFDKKFEFDKILSVKQENGKPSIMGIILDLKRDNDFSEACNDGLVCEMPSCKRYMKELSDQGDDFELSTFIDYLDEDEIKELIRTYAKKVQAGAELIPQGMYVIVDNKMFYLTANEYDEIRSKTSFDSQLYCLVDNLGILQLEASLLKDNKEALYTISRIVKSKYLVDKPYLDLSDEASIGESTQDFISDLLSDNPNAYELAEAELKPKTDTK